MSGSPLRSRPISPFRSSVSRRLRQAISWPGWKNTSARTRKTTASGPRAEPRRAWSRRRRICARRLRRAIAASPTALRRTLSFSTAKTAARIMFSRSTTAVRSAITSGCGAGRWRRGFPVPAGFRLMELPDGSVRSMNSPEEPAFRLNATAGMCALRSILKRPTEGC